MNMQRKQRFTRTKPFRLKKSRFSLTAFDLQKKPGAFKNSRNFKIWLQKSQIGDPVNDTCVGHARCEQCACGAGRCAWIVSELSGQAGFRSGTLATAIVFIMTVPCLSQHCLFNCTYVQHATNCCVRANASVKIENN